MDQFVLDQHVTAGQRTACGAGGDCQIAGQGASIAKPGQGVDVDLVSQAGQGADERAVIDETSRQQIQVAVDGKTDAHGIAQ